MKKRLLSHLQFIFLFSLALNKLAVAQTAAYSINLNAAPMQLDSVKLKLGGSNSKDDIISFNNYYLSYNHQPFIPVTGEMHYIRYPEVYWDEAIKKMKAGGINMIATYVFWNVHEEKEGVFDWSGNRNLRRFIELCAANQIQAIVRIGPFCHGEIRNGGLPDWLLGKPFSVRSNDAGYLACVEKLYNEIGLQLKGLLFKDGGPVAGIQVENEYQHSAAPWGLTYPGQPYDMTSATRDRALVLEGVGVAEQKNPYAALGNEHMRILKALAIKAGMDVPLYTVTGWGNAAVIDNESLPVTGAYPYPTWTPVANPSPSYIYQDLHKTPEYAPVRYKPEDYPVFCAELGGGIMVTYSRRPLVPAKSMDALINRFVGSGANGLGYYMFHGGSTPKGAADFFSDEAYGYPKISYDFQAPIGEFGQLNESFHRLKLIHFFLNSFGNILAPMQTVLQNGNDTIKAENITQLRYAAREKDGSGFLFINNFQDHAGTKDKTGLSFKVLAGKEYIRIPSIGTFNLNADENAILPVNISIEGIHFNYATAQLLTKLDNKQKALVFFSPEGMAAEFSIADKQASVKNITGAAIRKSGAAFIISVTDTAAEFEVTIRNDIVRVLVINKALALKSWLVKLCGMNMILFADATVYQKSNDVVEMLTKDKKRLTFYLYPAGKFTNYEPHKSPVSMDRDKPPLSFFETVCFDGRFYDPAADIKIKAVNEQKSLISISGPLPYLVNDFFLKVDYTADGGMAFINSELVADEFYKGIPWEIGLKKFMLDKKNKDLLLYFRPIFKDAPYLVDFDKDKVPDFSTQKKFTKINKISIIPEYRFSVSNWDLIHYYK